MSDPRRLLDQAISKSDDQAVQLLLERTLIIALERQNSSVTNLLLEQVKLSDEASIDLLRTVVEQGLNAEVIAYIESDMSLTSQRVIDLSNDRLDEIVLSQNVSIEKLDWKLIRLLTWRLQDYLADRIEGYLLAEELDSSMQDVGYALEASDLYAHTLRYLVLKRPSYIQLLDWMISRRDPRLVEAARCVVDNTLPRGNALSYSESVEPYRALLLCIAYPNVSVKQLRADLLAESVPSGVRAPVLEASMALVGAYLGADAMRAR